MGKEGEKNIKINYIETSVKKVDAFTKENISGYLKYFDLENKKILTSDGSGDQILNATFFGARDIALCNSNIVAKYYLYLKIAGLLEFDYKEFQWFFLKNDMNMHHNNKMFSKRLYNKIKPMLKLINKDAFYFFEKQFELNSNLDVRNNLFIDSGYHNKALKNFNIYLRNENAYNKLRDAIIKINLEYINKDVLKDEIDKKYDIILLSSLCTKLALTEFSDLISRLNSYNLNDEGIIIMCYLWNNNIYTQDYANIWKKIYQDPKMKKIIRKYITEVVEVSGYKNYLWEDNKREDKVLIYRKQREF